MARSGQLWRGVVGLVLPVLLAGCGSGAIVVAGPPRASPYEGPLYVEVTAPPTDEKADRSGAAGLVVRCASKPVGSSWDEPYAGEVGSTPERGLQEAFDDSQFSWPAAGYRKARAEDDRVLFTYDNDGAPLAAIVMRRGPTLDRHTGWHIESFARCNLADFPESFAEDLDLQVWTDQLGRRVSTDLIVSGPGPAHCDWQDMTFLSIDGGDLESGQTYVSHPDPELEDYFAEAYVAAQALPPDAVDSGYSLAGGHLWFSPDRQRAYVGQPQEVARWPATVKPLGCA